MTDTKEARTIVYRILHRLDTIDAYPPAYSFDRELTERDNDRDRHGALTDARELVEVLEEMLK